jgi:hypothetical protein
MTQVPLADRARLARSNQYPVSLNISCSKRSLQSRIGQGRVTSLESTLWSMTFEKLPIIFVEDLEGDLFGMME